MARVMVPIHTYTGQILELVCSCNERVTNHLACPMADVVEVLRHTEATKTRAAFQLNDMRRLGGRRARFTALVSSRDGTGSAVTKHARLQVRMKRRNTRKSNPGVKYPPEFVLTCRRKMQLPASEWADP